MSVSVETLAHNFEIHGDGMSPDGRRKVAEAIESGEGFVIVLADFNMDSFNVDGLSVVRLVQLSNADWTALLGFEPQPNPTMGEIVPGAKCPPCLWVYPILRKLQKLN